MKCHTFFDVFPRRGTPTLVRRKTTCNIQTWRGIRLARCRPRFSFGVDFSNCKYLNNSNILLKIQIF